MALIILFRFVRIKTMWHVLIQQIYAEREYESLKIKYFLFTRALIINYHENIVFYQT